MSDQDRRVSDQEARELFRRATELQLEAEAGAARGKGSEGDALLAPTPGYSVHQVVRAAEEAGISADHVLFALAERQLPDAHEIAPDNWTARWLRFLLDDVDSVEITHRIPAFPDRVLEAVSEVTSRDAFAMSLEDRLGTDPARDGVLVYRRREPSSPEGSSSFRDGLDYADGRVILMTIRAEGEATRLRLRMPLYLRGVNLALTGGSAGLAGWGGTAAGIGVGEALVGIIGVASMAVVAVPAVVGALAGGGGGVWAYRGIYRWARRKGEASLALLAKAVAVEAGQGRLEPGDP